MLRNDVNSTSVDVSTKQEPSALARTLVSKPELKLVSGIKIDRSRDDLLTDFGKASIKWRKLSGYVCPGFVGFC